MASRATTSTISECPSSDLPIGSRGGSYPAAVFSVECARAFLALASALVFARARPYRPPQPQRQRALFTPGFRAVPARFCSVAISSVWGGTVLVSGEPTCATGPLASTAPRAKAYGAFCRPVCGEDRGAARFLVEARSLRDYVAASSRASEAGLSTSVLLPVCARSWLARRVHDTLTLARTTPTRYVPSKAFGGVDLLCRAPLGARAVAISSRAAGARMILSAPHRRPFAVRHRMGHMRTQAPPRALLGLDTFGFTPRVNAPGPIGLTPTPPISACRTGSPQHRLAAPRAASVRAGPFSAMSARVTGWIPRATPCLDTQVTMSTADDRRRSGALWIP
ncbi:hypothetical protein B0H14DRAFT_3522578 [Mycena olivaceomarginata]|nr:hypothetical protein B0H14DRAFT_3522578 [Mycena olivaceomarginata]